MKKELVRLQKMLADCGVDSRRKCEELIRRGSVKVNGKVAVIGDKVDPYTDKVYVKGKRVTAAAKPKYRYIMLNKPRGYVTTMSDERGRKCVAELIEDIEERVYPIGRLDKDSEGMLLLTNDGEFANHIMHPKKHINKVYRVTVKGKATEEQIDRMAVGMKLEEYTTQPCDIGYIEKHEDRTVLRFTLYEGKNREIRKLCEAVGLDVIRLKRVEIAGIKLGMLPQGRWRELTEKEVKRLMSISISKENQND